MFLVFADVCCERRTKELHPKRVWLQAFYRQNPAMEIGVLNTDREAIVNKARGKNPQSCDVL